MDIESLFQEIEKLKCEQKQLRSELEQYKLETDCKLRDVDEKYCLLEGKLIMLESKLSSIESNTSAILNINKNQNDKLDSLLNKFADSVLETNKELMNESKENFAWFRKLNWKHYLTFGSLIGLLIIVIKFFLGIPF